MDFSNKLKYSMNNGMTYLKLELMSPSPQTHTENLEHLVTNPKVSLPTLFQ